MTAKVKIIISDTHLGAGGADLGNKLEDFISDEAFFAWVHGLIEESTRAQRAMTLIINGDWIEFLQVPEVAVFDPTRRYPTERYVNLSEEAAIKRLEVVHAGHPRVFQALADFISEGPPRRDLVILFGNHDPELAYPGVQTHVRALLHAEGARAHLVRIGERRYFEDGVFVEHGNAFTEAVNRFSDPDHPFDPDQPELIERPPGSYVVTDFYNQVEWERPWIDGVHPMSALAFYALAYDPRFAAKFIKALLLAAPDLATDLLTAAPQARAGQRLLDLLESMDAEELARRLQQDEAFARDFADDLEQALAEKGAAPTPELKLAATPEEGRSPQQRARDIVEYYWRALAEAALQVSEESGAQVVCFGHIHERVDERLANGARYLNTGTWIWKMNFKEASDEVWRDLIAHPEKYMHRRLLTYARIDIAEDGRITSAQLRLADDPPPPVEPPEPMPPAGLWARFVLGVRRIIAKLTGWV
jgi:UDP-2,3-diacylglucosamine pyrophosphatase LpxH